jgi:hypothetical protein
VVYDRDSDASAACGAYEVLSAEPAASHLDSVARDYDSRAGSASACADYSHAGPAEGAIEEPLAAVEVEGGAALVAAKAAAVDDGAVGQLVAAADALDEVAADAAAIDPDRRNAARAEVVLPVSQARRR